MKTNDRSSLTCSETVETTAAPFESEICTKISSPEDKEEYEKTFENETTLKKFTLSVVSERDSTACGSARLVRIPQPTSPVTTVPAGIELYSEQDVQEFYHWLDTQMVAPVLKNTLSPKQEKMFENEPATIVTEKTPGNNLVIILMSTMMTMMKNTSNDSPAADAKRYMDLNRLHLRAASRQFPSRFVT